MGTEKIGEYEHAIVEKFRPYWDLAKEKVTGRVVDKEERAKREEEGREERKNHASMFTKADSPEKRPARSSILHSQDLHRRALHLPALHPPPGYEEAKRRRGGGLLGKREEGK